MSEIIEKIEYKKEQYERYRVFEGYVISTNKQQIKIMMENASRCCEFFGIILYFDGKIPAENEILNYWQQFENIPQNINLLDSLIGKEIKNISFSNIPICPEFNVEKNDYETNTAYVDIILADEKKIQIYAWNQHNGFYAHELYVKWNEKEEFQNI